MFDLESTIQNWKQSFGMHNAVGPKEILELESHLRELVADLGKRGLNEREAFMVGTDRLGHPSELEQEYTKVTYGAQWRKRVFWMLSGYIAMTVTGSVIAALVTVVGAGLGYVGVEAPTAAIVMVSLMILAWCSCGVIFFSHQLQNFEIRNRHLWFIATGLLLIVAPVISAAGNIAQSRVASLSWHGESLWYLSLGGTAANFGIVAFCFVAMWLLSKPAMTLAQVD